MVDPSVVNELKFYKNIDLHINTYDFKTYLNQYNCLNYCFEHLGLEHAIYVEDDVEIKDVFGSLPVSELRPRKAVRTRIKVSAIFDDLPASSAAFL